MGINISGNKNTILKRKKLTLSINLKTTILLLTRIYNCVIKS